MRKPVIQVSFGSKLWMRKRSDLKTFFSPKEHDEKCIQEIMSLFFIVSGQERQRQEQWRQVGNELIFKPHPRQRRSGLSESPCHGHCVVVVIIMVIIIIIVGSTIPTPIPEGKLICSTNSVRIPLQTKTFGGKGCSLDTDKRPC